MATDEEIERRVAETDRPRTAKRSAAAQRVGELARRRSTVAMQLDEIERQLGQVLMDSEEVIDVDELARFTDVPAADLVRWRTAARSPQKAQAKRKRPSASTSNVDRGAISDSSATKTPPTAVRTSTSSETARPRSGVAEQPSAGATAGVD